MLCGKIIRIIYACSAYKQSGGVVIGKNGRMPWEGLIPSDMRRFKRLTCQPDANSVIVGRKTFASIPERFRPFDKNLPVEEARQTIILTRNSDFGTDDPRVAIAHSFEEAVAVARSQTVWIIGGAEIYSLALPHADYQHITSIRLEFEGDTFFPQHNTREWKCIEYGHLQIGGPGAENDKVGSSYLVSQRVKQ